jgi:hypothetical protein
MAFDRKAGRDIMAAAWEETTMRKLIGLCFLSATLLATSAHAQGIFIDRGDPSAISATANGAFVKNGYGGGVGASWTYRGVFDTGADLIFLKYNAGSTRNLSSLTVAPFLTWHIMRVEENEMPISISATLGAQRDLYFGNTPVANPEGFAAWVGPSVYRRFELGSSLVFVPEAFVAYEYRVTRYYSSALDAGSGIRDAAGGSGYDQQGKHSFRALFRPNFLVKAGNTRYVIQPYAGYVNGVAAGGNIGALF